PGGGITLMADVTRMPENSFGSVPTPALVAPIEFTMQKEGFRNMGGHMDSIRKLEALVEQREVRIKAWNEANPWPF
ncbi:MAG TPA: 6-hydroxynicotinate reductase, partial [SAR324 cluster bacterium]|nr:6-hydroxynicotinate reductase [SAR324 cluster bacterium]